MTKIAAQIGMSVQNLHKCIRDGRIEAGALEKIAQVFGVLVSCFFDEDEQLSEPKGRKSCPGCKDKERIIRLLEDKVSLLEEKLEGYGDKTVKRAG